MNKTISINLGGYFFHIDEDAYQKLSRYFEAVKRSLSPEGRDEIIKDIEGRVAEIFQDKLKQEKQVVTLKDVDDMISIMGQPEDYRINDDEQSENTYAPNYNYTSSKKFYRDKDNALLGGVLAGLGHYFRIDPLWLRILMILLVFGAGTGIFVYIILWILIPPAKTTAQKLEMQGEPITINNIEKKVKEGFAEISDKFQSIDHEKVAQQAKNGAEKVGNALGEVFLSIFNILGKILGVFITLFASLSLVSVIIGSFIMIFTSTLPQSFYINHIEAPFSMEIPYWIQGILILFSIGIPLLFFLILGLKLIVNNLKPMNNFVKYTLLGIWIIALLGMIYLGVKQATEISFDGKVVKKEMLSTSSKDTLTFSMRYNDFYTKSFEYRTDKKYTHDEKGNPVIFSNDVRLYFLPAIDSTVQIQVEKYADGKSHIDATQRAEKINYKYEIKDKTIIFDNYFITDTKNKFRDQHIKVYIYLPKGTVFKTDKAVRDFDYSENDYFNLHHSSDEYIYKVSEQKIKCLNCPPNENEWNDIENMESFDNQLEKELDSIKNISVKINNNEMKIKVDKDQVEISKN